ncbi:MAG TPA: DUF1858 domain-containing protein [Candidatus Nanoarchaeia archaeon]|nr:DUF1858 domain-containing protein [Candidatus Nanoarchaeia archaeon]
MKKKVKKRTIKKTEKKITKEMLLTDVMKNHPSSINIMFKYGLHCMGCQASSMETIEDGCKAHLMGEEDINSLIKEINEAEGLTLPTKVTLKKNIPVIKPKIIVQDIKPEKAPILSKQIQKKEVEKKGFFSKLFLKKKEDFK